MPKDDRNQIRCSFCGKTQEQVDRIIAGPNVYICNECIEACADIIFDDEEEAENTGDMQFLENIPKPKEINKVLSDYVEGGRV